MSDIDTTIDDAVLTAANMLAADQEDSEAVFVTGVLILVEYTDSDGEPQMISRRTNDSPWHAYGLASAYLMTQAAEQAAMKVERFLNEDDD